MKYILGKHSLTIRHDFFISFQDTSFQLDYYVSLCYVFFVKEYRLTHHRTNDSLGNIRFYITETSVPREI